MKKNSDTIITIIIVLSIFLFGIFLRIINLDKPTGMWLDEINTYNIARHSFPFGIIHLLKYYEPHTPLFYFILHFWMALFGESDIAIRSLSVLFGGLLIVAGYFAGKELDSKFTGYVTAALLSCSAILVYFSQEVRMYSFVHVLVMLLIYSLIKIRNNPTKFNYIGLILVNTILLYSYFTAFVLILLETIVMSIYLYFYQRKNLKNFLIAMLLVFVLFLPYLPTLTYQILLCPKYTVIWRKFYYLSLLFMVQEWFSPELVLMYGGTFANYKKILFGWHFIIGCFVPVAIYLTGILLAIVRKKFLFVPFFISLAFLGITIFSAVHNKIVLESRYTSIILPIFILIAAYGLSNIKTKYLKFFLIAFLFCHNVCFMLFWHSSKATTDRLLGYKSIIYALHWYNFNSKDMVVAPMSTIAYNSINDPSSKIFIEKYTREDPQLKDIQIVPFNYPYIITHNVDPHNKIKKSIYMNNDVLKPYIYSDKITDFNRQYFKKEIDSKLKKGQRLCLAFQNQYGNEQWKTQHPRSYYHPDYVGLFLISCCKGQTDILKLCNKHYKSLGMSRTNYWDLYFYEK